MLVNSEGDTIDLTNTPTVHFLVLDSCSFYTMTASIVFFFIATLFYAEEEDPNRNIIPSFVSSHFLYQSGFV